VKQRVVSRHGPLHDVFVCLPGAALRGKQKHTTITGIWGE
jgi:hypothetical protein